MTANATLKCELLVKVQEIVLSSCVELAEEFLEPVLSLAHDQNQEVRKQVVSFIEQIWWVHILEIYNYTKYNHFRFQ